MSAIICNHFKRRIVFQASVFTGYLGYVDSNQGYNLYKWANMSPN